MVQFQPATFVTAFVIGKHIDGGPKNVYRIAICYSAVYLAHRVPVCVCMNVCMNVKHR